MYSGTMNQKACRGRSFKKPEPVKGMLRSEGESFTTYFPTTSRTGFKHDSLDAFTSQRYGASTTGRTTANYRDVGHKRGKY